MNDVTNNVVYLVCNLHRNGIQVNLHIWIPDPKASPTLAGAFKLECRDHPWWKEHKGCPSLTMISETDELRLRQNKFALVK